MNTFQTLSIVPRNTKYNYLHLYENIIVNQIETLYQNFATQSKLDIKLICNRKFGEQTLIIDNYREWSKNYKKPLFIFEPYIIINENKIVWMDLIGFWNFNFYDENEIKKYVKRNIEQFGKNGALLSFGVDDNCTDLNDLNVIKLDASVIWYHKIEKTKSVPNGLS